jgi:hypothetical protein
MCITANGMHKLSTLAPVQAPVIIISAGHARVVHLWGDVPSTVPCSCCMRRDRLLKQVALENHLVALHHQHHQHQAAKGPSSSTPGASVITGSGASGSETAASNTSSGAQGAGGVSAGGGLMGSSTGAGGVRVIEERLAPADLDAARAVLRHMWVQSKYSKVSAQTVWQFSKRLWLRCCHSCAPELGIWSGYQLWVHTPSCCHCVWSW